MNPNFTEINPKDYIEDLCKEYRRLDQHLEYPKNQLPKSFNTYSFDSNGIRKIKLSKFFRNISTLEKLESLINHLDLFFISVEYFQNKVELKRNIGDELKKPFKDKLFLLIIADSLRSSLDIYSKFVAWYFDFPNKKELGFSYKNFIKKVEKYSTKLKDLINELYNSAEYNLINDLRNADKHIGFDRFEMNINRSKQKFEIKVERIEPLNYMKVEKAACLLLKRIKSIIKASLKSLNLLIILEL